jgi:hypothetical protein
MWKLEKVVIYHVADIVKQVLRKCLYFKGIHYREQESN